MNISFLLANALLPFERVIEQPTLLAWLLGMLMYATYTDITRLKITNRFNLALATVNSLLFVLLPLLQGEYKQAVSSLAGGAIGFVILLIPAVATGFKMGGDIKFVGAFGLALSASGSVLFLILSVLLNGLTNGTLIALKKKTMQEVIPFAPFFAVSFIILTTISAL